MRTRQQCRTLIRDRARIAYNGTTRDVLVNLLDCTYHPEHDSAEGRTVTRKLKRLMRGLGIELRQFEYILKRLREEGILLDYHRENGSITYRLDLTHSKSWKA